VHASCYPPATIHFLDKIFRYAFHQNDSGDGMFTCSPFLGQRWLLQKTGLSVSDLVALQDMSLRKNSLEGGSMPYSSIRKVDRFLRSGLKAKNPAGCDTSLDLYSGKPSACGTAFTVSSPCMGGILKLAGCCGDGCAVVLIISYIIYYRSDTKHWASN
jgi:hypothetical protein